MGKHKQKFNKKEAIRFILVPDFDQNGKPITHFRPVQTKKSKVNPQQRERLIQQISDQVYDEIQINGKKVSQSQIPAFVLQQIRGRKDLIINQKPQMQNMNAKQDEGDLYDVVNAQDYDDQEFGQQEQWTQEEDIIDQQQYDDEQGLMQQNQDEWQDQDQLEEIDIQNQDKNKTDNKQFVLKEQDFPVLNKINLDGKEYELTEEQIKLLDVLIPENYQKFQIKGIKFQKYNEDGLPISQKAQYQQFLATGKQGIVDSFVYVPEKPTPIYDNDLKPSQITGDLRQIQEALNFEGEQQAYQQLQDDFFTKLIKSEIQANKKEKKQKKKSVSKSIKAVPTQVLKANLPKILEKSIKQSQQNIFTKYDELDQDVLEEEITDQMLQKALDDFQNNLQPVSKGNLKNKIKQQDQQEMQENHSRNNASRNFSQIQRCQELFGKDGELDWRCLSKKQKKQYMKTKIIRDFYDEVRQRQIQDKLKGKKNVTSEQLHLKTMVKHLTFEQDHVMRKALEEHAKQTVDLEEDQSLSSQSQEQDIVEYHQRTSVISTNLNQISEPSKKRNKKKKQNQDQNSKQIDQLSATLSKLKSSAQKRQKNETKEERKERKEKQKQVKKEKRELKKQFAEKFSQERRKHIKMTKPSDPLHKVSFVKII